MYMDRALISDLECGRTEHYIIIKNVQRQNVIVYIIILSSSQELSQCLFISFTFSSLSSIFNPNLD